MDEKVDHFDYCQRENWCCQFIDDFVKELCYDLKDPKLAVYWLKQLADNGTQQYLVAINSEHTARAMAEDSVNKNPIVLYVDHVNFLAKQGSDDVSSSGACLPKVLSPRKGEYVEDDSEEEGSVEDDEEREDSESDPDFNDSDYDFEDDDGLFVANVDEKVADVLEIGRAHV